MNTTDLATWAAVVGAALGLVAAVYSMWNTRSANGRVPDSQIERVHVVIVSPKEDRRYFLSVPEGIDTPTLLDSIATAIEQAESRRVSRADTHDEEHVD
ncbi:hypothetical protein [Mycobacterium sp. ACS4331]|uniref:hypothetical protein n=1 Tax=Mycobacterium sp. ACS4331 TaxID=1834121 RepID=UPI0007FE0010|nr:hypothetical protein [Mycobacterium sp. ACS4331]OBF29666.1 hypothetical protein A5727_23615 [Mycobacterium sp. ACS4331]